MRLTVLIADDDPTLRRVLVELFREQPDLEVAGEARTAQEAAELAERLKPDLALLDVRMPGGGGAAAAREIAGRSPGTRIVAYSGHDDAGHVREMLRAGAVAYAVKDGTTTELFAAIRTAAARTPRAPRAALAPDQVREVATVRVLVLHPDAMVLEALADGLDHLAAAELVGLAQSESHALSLAARHLPDVALVPTGDDDGARARTDLEAATAGIRTVALTAFRDRRAAALGETRHFQVHPDALAELETVLVTGAPPKGRSRILTVPLVPSAEDPPEARVRHLLRSDIGIALQPIVHIPETGHVAGHEALSRFPDGRTPDVVFAEAHRCGLGLELELHALECALTHLGRLHNGAFLSVNLGPDSILDRRLDELLDGVPPERLVFELTEHAPVRDYDALVQRLRGLRERGHRIAVDDCGAGFASLRHVVLVDPDFLKLDVVLCRDVREPVRWAMTRALAGFAAETGAIAVAEGVEERADLEALAELGVPMGQGLLLGEPVGAAR